MHEFFSSELNGRGAADFDGDLPHTLPELDIVSGTLSGATGETTGHIPIIAGEGRRGVPAVDAFRTGQPAANHPESPPENSTEAGNLPEATEQPPEERPAVSDTAYAHRSMNNAEPQVTSYATIEQSIRDTLYGDEIPSRENSHQGAKELTDFLRSQLGLLIPEHVLRPMPITADDGTTLSFRASSQNTTASVVRIEANHPLVNNGGVWEQQSGTGSDHTGDGYTARTVTTFHADERGLTVTRTITLHDAEGDTPLCDSRTFAGGTAIARMIRDFLRKPAIGENEMLPENDS